MYMLEINCIALYTLGKYFSVEAKLQEPTFYIRNAYQN